MIKLGPKSAKAVLVLHYCSLALWLGGVLSCLPLLFYADETLYDSIFSTYLYIRMIAWNVIGWGGIGGFVTGLILAVFTNWGLFKHKWVTTKFFLVIGLILFGMFFNEHRILMNINLMETSGADAVTETVFLKNHTQLKTGMLISVFGFILLIAIAVFKPWMNRKSK